jgi:type VI secretion system secreted protein Hcp
MSWDMFMQIDGIKSDSTDDKHKQWIEVISYKNGVTQPVGGSVSAQGAHTGGRADHDDFIFTKRLDSATPILYQYCCTAKHIPNIKFELCRAMGDKTTFMVYTFKDSIIAGVHTTGTGAGNDPLPIEDVALKYGEIRWEYTPTDITGGGKKGATVQAGWSLMMNKAT